MNIVVLFSRYSSSYCWYSCCFPVVRWLCGEGWSWLRHEANVASDPILLWPSSFLHVSWNLFSGLFSSSFTGSYITELWVADLHWSKRKGTWSISIFWLALVSSCGILLRFWNGLCLAFSKELYAILMDSAVSGFSLVVFWLICRSPLSFSFYFLSFSLSSIFILFHWNLLFVFTFTLSLMLKKLDA